MPDAGDGSGSETVSSFLCGCQFVFWLCAPPAKRLRNECGDIFIDSARNLLMSNIGFGNVSSLTSYSVMYSSFTTLLLIMLSAVIAAMEGYSYLYDRRKVDRFHSEPVRRRIRFFSIYLNGFKNFAHCLTCAVFCYLC